MQTNRLETGGRIDRSKPLNFFFNGKAFTGYEGDTLASALLANGVSLVGRSFKLRRPRGIVGSGAEEPNAIMQIGQGGMTQPNVRATQALLRDGLIAKSTRGWPSLRFDIGSMIDVFSSVVSAGFYYKTFMHPQSMWTFYEKLIRESAGFGKAPKHSDPNRYEHQNAHCDVLVAGAGPAGLMAALTAASAGARVIIADDQAEFGGNLLSSTENVDSKPACEWIRQIVSALSKFDDVTLLNRSTVFGYHDHNFLTIVQECEDHVRQREWRVRAKQVVLAQGAFERPLVFCNNDRPGIMQASAVSTYINRYAVCPGSRAVVFTNNDSAYQTAIDLQRAGATVAAVVDSRSQGGGAYATTLEDAGVPLLHGHLVTDVTGQHRISRAHIAKWDGDTRVTVENRISISCDLIAVSGGWSSAVHLHSQAGGKNYWDDNLNSFVPGETLQQAISAGSGNGKWGLRDCLQDGCDAGATAVKRCGMEPDVKKLPVATDHKTTPMQPLWRVPATVDPDRCPKQFLDFQNDTCVSDIRLAVREGYRNVEHVKRYTALGFGTDQGKLGNINGMAVLAETLQKPIENVGTTAFRPPYTPVSFGACAGESIGSLYDPVRKTAIHDWHEAARAEFENVGQWHRPWYFPQRGEDLHATVARECLATRKSVGILDASTLGKIDVQGPDSVKFLERIYTHNVGKMKIGRCAYGIMLGEDGMIMDDGVMARIDDQRFYLTTTTGGAAAVLSWLELWLQTEWPGLDVFLTSVTDHYSTIAVAGPNSAKLLEKVGSDIPLSSDKFPFMSVRSGQLNGIPVQLFRVSFSGELAFEINIDSNYALSMWQAIMKAGQEFDITPYGTEAMHVLRAEKGFIIVGQDTDGSVTPVDLRMNWMLSKNKDFIGKRSLSRPDCLRDNRKQLVGLISKDGKTVLPEGAQLVEDPSTPVPVPMCGHVSSSYMSSCLGHPIALALVAGGHSRMGEPLYASSKDNSFIPVTITSPIFYDSNNERQNV